MKDTQSKPAVFKGAGYVLGFSLAMLTATIVFLLSKNVSLAISTSIPLGVATGIGFEQEFQNKVEMIDPRTTKIMVALLSLGVLIALTLYFLVNYG